MKRVHDTFQTAYETAYGNAYEMGLTGDRTTNPFLPSTSVADQDGRKD